MFSFLGVQRTLFAQAMFAPAIIPCLPLFHRRPRSMTIISAAALLCITGVFIFFEKKPDLRIWVSPPQSSTILSLPDELLCQIAGYLPLESVASLSVVSKRLHTVLQSQTLDLSSNERAKYEFLKLLLWDMERNGPEKPYLDVLCPSCVKLYRYWHVFPAWRWADARQICPHFNRQLTRRLSLILIRD